MPSSPCQASGASNQRALSARSIAQISRSSCSPASRASRRFLTAHSLATILVDPNPSHSSSHALNFPLASCSTCITGLTTQVPCAVRFVIVGIIFLSCLPRWGLVSERVKYDTYIGSCQLYLQTFYKFLTLAPHDRNSPPKPTHSISQIMRTAYPAVQI